MTFVEQATTEPESTAYWRLVLGADAAPPPMRELRAGPVTALLDGIELRYVRLGTLELVRRVYAAVRDDVWATIPGVVHELAVEESETGFEVDFDVEHAEGEIAFAWHGSISGDADGRVTISMSGRAGRPLVYNRIGLCVLLPPALAGRPLRGYGPGSPWDGRLPDDIGPQRSVNGILLALHPAAERLEFDLDGGPTMALEFTGDLFESEDQRNWTDASFKIYSTPLALGLPRRCAAGAVINQQVALRTKGGKVAEGHEPAALLRVGGPTGSLIPRVGLGLGSPVPAHSPGQLALLAALKPAHLRLDCHLESPGWKSELDKALRTCRATDAEIELAVFLRTETTALDDLAEALSGQAVARVFVFFEGAVNNSPEETTPSGLIDLARRALGDRFTIAAGTDLNFCELNRSRPDLAAVDGLVWPMSPQVHAFDDSSIVETPEAQARQVSTAKRFAPGKALFVGPVTLLPRYNPNVATERGPSPADVRQATLLAAAFTLSSLKQLAEAGADAVTYYETVGARGVVSEHVSTGAPPRGFPVFHVLADAAGLGGEQVLEVTSSRPLSVTGLATRRDAGTTLLVANTTPRALSVELEGVGPQGALRRLNADSAHPAGLAPEAFRSAVGPFTGSSLVLGPYETVRLEYQS